MHDHLFPKYRHCLDGGGLSSAWICPLALRALKGDHFSPKSDDIPSKVFLVPQNRQFNHIFIFNNIFTLKHDLRTFVKKKCWESHLRICMGKIAQDTWIGGSTFRQCLYFGDLWPGSPSLNLPCSCCHTIYTKCQLVKERFYLSVQSVYFSLSNLQFISLEEINYEVKCLFVALGEISVLAFFPN